MVKVFTVPDALDDDNGPEQMISQKCIDGILFTEIHSNCKCKHKTKHPPTLNKEWVNLCHLDCQHDSSK